MPVPELVELGPRPAAVVRASMAASDLPPFFARAYGAVAAAAAGQGLEVAGEPFAFCPNTPTEVVEVAAGFPVSGAVQPAGDVVPMELPGGRAVTTVHVGPYDTLHETYAQMREWMAAQGLTPGRSHVGGLPHRPEHGTRSRELVYANLPASQGLRRRARLAESSPQGRLTAASQERPSAARHCRQVLSEP